MGEFEQSQEDILFSTNQLIKEFPQNGCVYLLCGSAVTKTKFRDIDYIVYANGDMDYTIKAICNILSKKHIQYELKPVDRLSMMSLKFSYEKVIVSIHLVATSVLNTALNKISDEKTYTDINIFSFDLKYPTIYRKWITETLYVSGDRLIYDEMKAQVKQELIPFDTVETRLYENMRLKVSYFKEIENSSAVSTKIIYIQLLNDLLLFCYAGNRKLWGTVKYVESDLSHFEVNKYLCMICEDALRGLGGSSESISAKIEEIDLGLRRAR